MSNELNINHIFTPSPSLPLKKKLGRPSKKTGDEPAPPKKKNGRPPKYATDEERKQKNRERALECMRKIRYTEEEVQRKVKEYENKLRSKMLISSPQ
jgi:hypothetical protein